MAAGLIIASSLLAACSSVAEWHEIETDRTDFEGIALDCYDVMVDHFGKDIHFDKDPATSEAHIQSRPVVFPLSDDFDFSRVSAFVQVRAEDSGHGYLVSYLVLIEHFVPGPPREPDPSAAPPEVIEKAEFAGGHWEPQGSDEDFENLFSQRLRFRLRNPPRRPELQEKATEPEAPPIAAPPAADDATNF